MATDAHPRSMQRSQAVPRLELVEDNGTAGGRSVASHRSPASGVGLRPGNRTDCARQGSAAFISIMILVPMVLMVVVLGFFATGSAQAAGPAAVSLPSIP